MAENIAQLFKRNEEPVLLLAPMQDVTDLPIWRLLARYGAPDCVVTEYIRVYPNSVVDKNIAQDILDNNTGTPIVAQIAGEDIPSLVKIAHDLHSLPIAGIDLNLGCPAQVVCRKNVGGALLKNLTKVEEILKTLRPKISLPFSVKCRLGYETPEHFPQLLQILSQAGLDWVTVHGRTVRQSYTGKSDWDAIDHAAQTLPCPVIGNGDILHAPQAVQLLKNTRVRGIMIGRGAIGNPWIYRQIRELLRGEQPFQPTAANYIRYLRDLRDATTLYEGATERSHVERIKKFLNYVGFYLGEVFLYRVRRATSWAEMESAWQETVRDPLLFE